MLYKPNYLDSLIAACGAIGKRGNYSIQKRDWASLSGKFVLIYAAGLAQLVAHGDLKEEFWKSGFDDPRDTYRVLQGIELYETRN